ncbi:soluble lytic murein transglycosylase [Clostridium cavendishii DSM 21758]|uniref:Soluble lytic murein transglycosylase n=1 Tax=Clostridium cavendishii DSM 21758 TaxID=1121302 RepID=A0A1M6NRZ3_9CLOT|nr:lytic transglycosylase domain-containing protein [Clostridium cavendishii]SHJ98455.1 soluble lytic murein transglycosylase [Clostridium cavendishii DSM 21758]
MGILKRIMIFCLVILIAFLAGKFIIKTYIFKAEHKSYVISYSRENSIDPRLTLAVIKAESNFDCKAKSKSNAIGLMQMTPKTGEWVAEQMGIYDFDENMLKNPETNIKFGTWYLKDLKEEFKDIDLAIAAYNAGRGNVKKWLAKDEHSMDGKTLNNIPFKETDKYVKKVNSYYNIYKKLYDENLE